MIIDLLYSKVSEKGPVCLGLDTRLDYLPQYLLNSRLSTEEKLFQFNKEIIDETIDLVACYKLQIACYEAIGLEGLRAYSRTLKYIRAAGALAIADIKRGDIASTAEMYAKGHFEGDFEADFITVNPYMGIDAISPYFKYLNTGQKGIFILIKTSNESSKDFQDLMVEGARVYQQVTAKVKEWGKEYIGSCGFSLVGGVVGLTCPEEFKTIAELAPNTFFLIPGYGAQGGTGEAVAELFKKSRCGVINSSREIITAHKGRKEDEDFAACAREKVLAMKEDIGQWLK
jgi:orotidine-5'-phosphate decarboxylase